MLYTARIDNAKRIMIDDMPFPIFLKDNQLNNVILEIIPSNSTVDDILCTGYLMNNAPNNFLLASKDSSIIYYMSNFKRDNIAKIVNCLDDYWFIKAKLTDHLIIDKRFISAINENIINSYKKIYIINLGDSDNYVFDNLAMEKLNDYDNIEIIISKMEYSSLE